MTVSLHIILALIFVAGFASQRGRTCAVSAAFEIAKRQRARRFIGFLFAAACSLMVLSILSYREPRLLLSFSSHWPSPSTFIGAIIFAVGAWINGRCSLGTIARLGSGDLPRIGTLVGIYAGISLSVSALPPTVMETTNTLPLLARVTPNVSIGFATINLTFMAWMMRKNVPVGFNEAHWPIWQSMAIIGVVNGLLVWLARDWSYTSLFSQIVRHETSLLSFGALSFALLLAGAVTGAVTGRQWRLHVGGVNQWLLAVCGGLLMGLGVALIPGGNDTMLLIGLPLMVPHLLAAYATVYTTLIVIAWLMPNRLL